MEGGWGGGIKEGEYNVEYYCFYIYICICSYIIVLYIVSVYYDKL